MIKTKRRHRMTFWSYKKFLVTGGAGLGRLCCPAVAGGGSEKEDILVPRSQDQTCANGITAQKAVKGQDIVIHLAAM